MGSCSVIFLGRIASKAEWIRNDAFRWLDQSDSMSGTRFYVDGDLVVPRESVLVYYANGDSQPRWTEFKLNEIPLRDPWWPDPEKLWAKIHTPERAFSSPNNSHAQ